MRLRAVSTRTTGRFMTVTRSPPKRPAIFLPGHTRPGSLETICDVTKQSLQERATYLVGPRTSCRTVSERGAMACWKTSKTPSLHYTSEAFPNPGFKFYKRGEPKARRVTSRFPHDVNELTRDKVNSRECGAWLFPFRARLNKLIPSPAPTNWDQCVFTDRKLGHNSFWPNPSLGKMSL